jgi:hypothetical protein
MKVADYHLEILDLFAYETNTSVKAEWITKISQEDLYKIASWLMQHLTKESSGVEHKRSNIRDMLAYYHDETRLYGNRAPWNEKSKWFMAMAVINLWPYRQLDQDPRYLL